jgi:O-antigen/teichoic acid export membrane protein
VPPATEDDPARREGRFSRAGRVPQGASEVRHAIPLAIAAALVGALGLLTTVFVAHVLTTREYGTLIVLQGLFLVVSMPAGTALLVGVVRRVSAWEAGGLGARVRPWVARVHLIGEVAIVVFAVVTLLIRVPVAHALSFPGPSGVTEILTAGAIWILVSIDRGLLQVGRDYTNLSINLVIEGTMRLVLTVGLAAEFKVEGAALGFLITEVVTASHARITSRRAVGRIDLATVSTEQPVEEPGEQPVDSDETVVMEQVMGVEEPGGVIAVAVHGGKDLFADVLTALGSLLLLAVLQNTDVLLLGSKAPKHAGAYAAISVPSKALVFGALVLVNYLLPEATIRHQRGSHALRQLGHTLAVLAVPCAALLAVAVVASRGLLGLVFGHRLTAAAPGFSTLVLAMVLLSVTVVLTVYLLGIGWRWVVVVLFAGAAALAAATAAAGGQYVSTARADLAAQAGLCVAMIVCFVAVHRRGARGRADAGNLPSGAPESLA